MYNSSMLGMLSIERKEAMHCMTVIACMKAMHLHYDMPLLHSSYSLDRREVRADMVDRQAMHERVSSYSLQVTVEVK